MRKLSPLAFPLALALALTSACSGTEEMMVRGKPKRVRKSVAAQFEWAVQAYEAGEYEEASRRFSKLRKEGAEVPDYDLISYYLGMGHFRLKQFEAATKELEAFLRSQNSGREGQEARLALLLAYEKLSRWKSSAALAAETDKMTLFHYNRALLKLLWARALREVGEIQGAKAVLEDSAAYLDKVSGEEGRAGPYYANPDQDLWGRYYFTSLLLKARDCTDLNPKKVKSGKAESYLYTAWIEAESDCLSAAVRFASQELFAKESSWGQEAVNALSGSIDNFGSKVKEHSRLLAKHLSKQAALKKESLEGLYRVLGTVDDQIKNFKDREVTPEPLEQLRKQIDPLLVSISSSS